MTKTDKLATFICTYCKQPRPYGDCCDDRRVHPRLHCAHCQRVTPHKYFQVETYNKTVIHAAADLKITDIKFEVVPPEVQEVQTWHGATV